EMLQQTLRIRSARMIIIHIVAAFLCVGLPSFAQQNGHKKGTYQNIKINDQVWMLENLAVDHFRNGDSIPEAKTVDEWVGSGREGKAAWCYYENNIDSGAKYGKLYNWYAVNHPRGIAPGGWHVPSDSEW